jgi:hypothetical protein
MTQFDQSKNKDINTTRSLRPCPDSDGLGCLGNENFTIGYVSEVNGPDSAEVPTFVPTRHELIQLVKYWATVVLDDEFFIFVYCQRGSREIRRIPFGRRRICRIATVLGEEAVQRAIDEAEEEYSKTTSPEAWSIFKNGTTEEQKAFQDEVLRSLDEPNSQCEEGSEGGKEKDADGQ